MKLIKYSAIIFIASFAACSTLTLQPADFAWPIESVLKVDDNGSVKEDRYSLTFNAKDLFLEETGDSLGYEGKEIRIIRDTKGFFYITAENFKTVYVFTDDEGKLCLDNKIVISEEAVMEDPVFNQRQPYIELVDGLNKHLLSNEGIKNEEE
jgi:hypothetical protein